MIRGWLARFGLAELAGTAGAFAGFAAGLASGSLLAAAALATACEAAGFYAVVLAKAAAASWRATGHRAGPGRMAAAAWHAVVRHLASCAMAEAADDFLVRPWCMAAGAWLARDLAPHVPAAVWAGFAAGKLMADAAWYGTEAMARHGMSMARPRRPVVIARRRTARLPDWRPDYYFPLPYHYAARPAPLAPRPEPGPWVYPAGPL